jgi:hypothetical protein
MVGVSTGCNEMLFVQFPTRYCSLLTMTDAAVILHGATNVVRGGGLATANEALHGSLLPTGRKN